jgi:hypothetical protein
MTIQVLSDIKLKKCISVHVSRNLQLASQKLQLNYFIAVEQFVLHCIVHLIITHHLAQIQR